MDFAWPNDMKYLEIDGEQHEWPDRKKQDEIKDSYCESLGWKKLRISWKYIMNNTQEAIRMIKDFISP